MEMPDRRSGVLGVLRHRKWSVCALVVTGSLAIAWTALWREPAGAPAQHLPTVDRAVITPGNPPREPIAGLAPPPPLSTRSQPSPHAQMPLVDGRPAIIGWEEIAADRAAWGANAQPRIQAVRPGKFELVPNWPIDQDASYVLPNYAAGSADVILLAQSHQVPTMAPQAAVKSGDASATPLFGERPDQNPIGSSP